MIWLDFASHLLVGRLQVRADNREGKVLQEFSELVLTAIEFMVSKRHGIKLQLIEGFGNFLATVKRVKQRSLELITNIQPEAVVVVGALLLNHGLDTRVATVAASLWPCAVRS